MTMTPDAPQPTPDALLSAGWRARNLPGFVGLVGPLWTRRDDDGWAYAIRTTAAHANPAGVVHGGLLVSLMDHALSAIAWEARGRQPCVTVQLDTHFLAPVPVGQLIEARGRVLRATASLVFMQGDIRAGPVQVLAATGVFKVVGSPVPG